MLKKIIVAIMVLSCIVVSLLSGNVTIASANGIVYRNVSPKPPAGLIAPAAAASGSVQFPGGIFLGSPVLPGQQALGRMSWGVVESNATISNAGSGDWTVSDGMLTSIIQFNPPYTSEPTCLFSAINTDIFASLPVYNSMGQPVYSVTANFYVQTPMGPNLAMTKFSFVCFQ
ncbi:MAG: hypothetical protein C0402_13870 [Thermodesulfovibrio sp.]|nr:hypothetical protein [Thermodesulfovibrio sp.]